MQLSETIVVWFGVSVDLSELTVSLSLLLRPAYSVQLEPAATLAAKPASDALEFEGMVYI